LNGQENTMKATIKYLAPWLAAAAIGGAIVLAPIASADTSPLVPPGSDPHDPYTLGLHEQNQDWQDTTNGYYDLPS
jgi:hypothetical protein